MQTNTRVLLIVLAALLGQLDGSFAATSLTAQQSGSVPIFLALPDAYPDVDGRVLLLREPAREIVVLAREATPEDLSIALTMLGRFRRERGTPESGRGHMVPIVGYAPAPSLSDSDRASLESALALLGGRPFANVGNLGRGRWMRFDER